MAWVRMSDTAAMHPIVLGVIDHPNATDDTVDVVFGYMTRLITLAAQYEADYVVPYATAKEVAGSFARADHLLELAAFSGYGVLEVDERTSRKLFKLVNDPEFIHIKTADELDFERQRKADNANPGICAPVRCRDGDACRYCGNVVRFTGTRRGKLAGTYDHRPPGQPGSAETSVVACGECNARRGNQPLEIADKILPLMSPPEKPYYHSSTREWLQSHKTILAQFGLTPPPEAPDQKNLMAGRPVPGATAAPADGVRRATDDPKSAAPQRPQPQPTAAASAAPAPGVRQAAPIPPETQAAADPAPKSVRPAAPNPTARSADPSRSPQIASVQDLDIAGRAGTGRVGSGQYGSGLHGPARSPHPVPPPAVPPSTKPARRRRGARGGRSRKPQGDSR